MMKIVLKILFLLLPFLMQAQTDNKWYAFYNRDSTKIGFKDVAGQVKIQPKFEGFEMAAVFDNVIAVGEKPALGRMTTYYLNKKGKTFGRDSVYFKDFSYPVESEGKISFRDRESGKVGFFDADGRIVIPAIYDEATDFHNNLSLVLYGAQRWCYDDTSKDLKDCEHIGWKGGKQFIINPKNERLFEIPQQKDFSFTIDYSRSKVNEKVDPEIYTSYQSRDGNTYSFYSPEKDFSKWLKTIFLRDFKKHGKVQAKYFYDLIAVADNMDPKAKTAWRNYYKSEISEDTFKYLNNIFINVVNGSFDGFVRWEGHNELIFAQNLTPELDFKNTITITYLPRADGDVSAKNSIQFTKIDGQFYITSIPKN